MAEATMYPDRTPGQFMTRDTKSLATMRALTLFKNGTD